MNLKWIGAILVIAGCGGVGFSMAAGHRREEATLRKLVCCLDYMECELHYRCTPLPELCRQAAGEIRGVVGQTMNLLAEELEEKTYPDVEGCMAAALKRCENLPGKTAEGLALLGASLGKFDLEGQIKGLESMRGWCRRELEGLSANRDHRLRGYQTLGLCAGAALAILFV